MSEYIHHWKNKQRAYEIAYDEDPKLGGRIRSVESRSLFFADVDLYQAFWVDGERWVKIPESSGVNATRQGGGKSTHSFADDQVIERTDHE